MRGRRNLRRRVDPTGLAPAQSSNRYILSRQAASGSQLRPQAARRSGSECHRDQYGTRPAFSPPFLLLLWQASRVALRPASLLEAAAVFPPEAALESEELARERLPRPAS